MNSKLLFSVAFLASTLLGSEVHAVGTRHFVLTTLESFQGGDATGVSIASDGTVRAGLTLAKLPIAEASSVWDSAVLDDGSVLLGTGAGGRIYRVQSGKASIWAVTGAMAVSSLALGFDEQVFAGTFPNGTIFKLDPNSKLDAKTSETGSAAEPLKPWLTLPETEDVWDLAYDANAKALYAATGPEGRLYRIDAAGKAEVYFDSDEPHLVSVAVAADGSVYTGSSGKALLYRVSGPGRATVVQDFEGDEVRSIAIVPTGRPHAGVVYATANDYRGAVRSLRPQKRAKLQATNDEQSELKAGKGKLVRFGLDGAMETLLDDADNHFATLALDAQGLPFVGLGRDGKVVTVDDHHITRVVADTDERQAAAVVVAGKTRFIATGDPVVFHEITGSGGTDALWTSKVLDAGMRAHFGRLAWTADGALELQTRSGNTEKPDSTWSDWSAALLQPGPAKSPAARFSQIRARFSADPTAVLHEVRLSFVTDNALAVLTSVEAGDPKSETGSATVPVSGAAPEESKPTVRLRWKLDNPDNDELRFRLFFQPAGSPRWTALLERSEVLTKKEYAWDTSGLPEGWYRVRVEATDELSNPPGAALQHSLESVAFAIDNTPPVFSNLTLVGDKLTGIASDGVGPIVRLEVALVGTKPFFPLAPSDGVFDQPSESFVVDIGSVVPAGPQQLVVRAFDAAGNRTSATISR